MKRITLSVKLNNKETEALFELKASGMEISVGEEFIQIPIEELSKLAM